jgi:amino acid adenylation domain-containing protein
MSNLPHSRVAQLSAAKQALLAQRLQGRMLSVGEGQSIPRRLATHPARLSFAQQRLWFLHQLEPDSIAYNLPRSIRLTGALQVEILAQSFSEILRRHEVLRTTIQSMQGTPIPTVAATVPIHLPIVNLQPLAEQERAQTVKALTTQEAQHPFDLAQGPLLRLKLLKLSPDEHILLLTLHHIVSDAWSTGVLVQEMATLYDAFTQGKPSPLPELTVQYSDFAEWQHQQEAQRTTQLSYWKKHLAGELSILQLPTDHSCTALPTGQERGQGAKQTCVLSPAMTAALKQLSQSTGTTLFMTLLAAFNTLLHRYTQQTDIVVGSPIANRNRAELEGMIGFFVNTLVFRVDVAGDPSFRALLGQVRDVALAAYAHQDCPFEVLVEALQPERNLGCNPLFQVMFALHNVPIAPLTLANLTLESLKSETGTAQVDLSLDLVETAEGLLATLEYRTDLFEADRIARMLGHFEMLLAGIITNPDQQLSQLPLLTHAEQQQILTQWNPPYAKDTAPSCIHEQFEAQVARTPQATAVTFADQQLTYAELNAKANQLAHFLRSRGVKPDQLVGLCVPRSLEMTVGILGILKAGGAYVPLDPTYPPERLAFILSDAQIELLVTHSCLPTSLLTHSMTVIDLGEESLNLESSENLSRTTTPEHLAYVIYTSGSTGMPKGVLVPHQALSSHSQNIAEIYQLQESDRVLQFASLNFDVAAEELFPTWLRGATVVLRTEETLMFNSFHGVLREAKLTVLNLPTAYWHEWVDYLTASQQSLPPTLRLVIVGTEAASLEKLRRWQTLAGSTVRWLNAYGPTEATISATVYEAPLMLTAGLPVVPIGRPLPEVQVYLLDPALNLTPIGVPGELCIAGSNLARGYLNHPTLTDEKFIPHPFTDSPGAHLYKTGDFARYLPDGTIELIGRRDRQVKIRGFRIELAEIEARLTECPIVREAVVTAETLSDGDRRLVAYVVPKDPSFLSEQARLLLGQRLREDLGQILPSQMIPSHFIALEAFPLLPNGKINRRVLPMPTAQPLQPTLLPQTALEQLIATLWQQALQIDTIGLHDNFFDIGGHSLLMVRVLSQLTDHLGKELTLMDLFRYPTIHALSQYLGETPSDPTAAPEITAQEQRERGKAHQRKRLEKMKSMGSSTGGQS